MSRFTPLRLLLATAMTAALTVVMQPTTPAAADVDVYTTPGKHFVNGREWSTSCEKYSSTVDRCRTEIKATQVTFEGGQYVQKTGFVFNNLTYLPSPRKDWKNNPLGNTGRWTTPDGRQWRTECDTAVSGGNGCRTFISATVIGVVKENPRTYGRVTKEIFNNIVQFSPPEPPKPPEPCSNLPIPAGFEVSVVGGKKIPHATKTPYEPNTLYNPTSISQFIRSVVRNTTLKKNDREKWDCLIDIGTTALMDGSTTDTYEGRQVRWFPYMFEFDASGSPEDVPPLAPGWHSGMAQGTSLGVLAELATATGDAKWIDAGDEVLNSFRVPFGTRGGFTNRSQDGTNAPWFEMYPTTPPTSVLNGQLEVLMGLDLWARDGRGANSTYARELFNEAIPTLADRLPRYEVDVQGGMLTSYDAMRGYDAAPLRLTTSTKNPVDLKSAQLNGVDVTAALPVSSPGTQAGKNMLDPVINERDSTRKADVWTSIAGQGVSTVMQRTPGTAEFTTDGRSWQGIEQLVPRKEFIAGEPLTMTLDAKLTLPDGKGLSGRVAVYQRCDADGTSLLFETQKPRSQKWSTYTMGFDAPPAKCDIWVQLLTGGYGLAGTQVEYRNIELRAADPVGDALVTDDVEGFDALSILGTPAVGLSLTGTGQATLEVHGDGVWHPIEDVTLTESTPVTIAVPERHTGRNLHYGYHENNVGLLGSLYLRAHEAGFTVDDVSFLRDYAVRWESMAPSRHGQVPPPIETQARSRMAQRGPDLDSYELPVVDPFRLLMEE